MTARIIGRRVEVGIGKESSRGIGVAPSFWIPKSEMTFFDRTTVVRPGESFGTIIGEGVVSQPTRYWAEGMIKAPLRSEHFGLLLLATFGSVVSTSPDAKQHVFSIQESNQHQSLTIHVSDPNADRVFELSMLNRLSLIVETNEVVYYEAEFMSQGSLTNTSPATPSYAAENVFAQQHVTVKFAAEGGSLDAASETRIRSLRLNINKNLVRHDGIGTLQAVDINNRQITISGEIEMTYEDRNTLEKQIAGTINAMRIAIVNNGVTIGGSSNPSFQIDLDRVNFEDWEGGFANDEISTQKFTFTALYNRTGDRLFSTCKLINETASY